MAKILLTDIDANKYYLRHMTIAGLGRILWPCKIVCTEEPGWKRGHVKLYDGTRKGFCLPLGFKDPESFGIDSDGKNVLSTDEFVLNRKENIISDYLAIVHEQLEIEQRYISKLNSLADNLKSITVEDLK